MPSNIIPNDDWLILGAEINDVVIVNKWRVWCQVVDNIPYCRIYTAREYFSVHQNVSLIFDIIHISEV